MLVFKGAKPSAKIGSNIDKYRKNIKYSVWITKNSYLYLILLMIPMRNSTFKLWSYLIWKIYVTVAIHMIWLRLYLRTSLIIGTFSSRSRRLRMIQTLWFLLINHNQPLIFNKRKSIIMSSPNRRRSIHTTTISYGISFYFNQWGTISKIRNGC